MKENKKQNWRSKLHIIIYEADTPKGKLFDVVLLFAIIASIVLVMLESVEWIDNKYHDILDISEWIITILFTIEYIARIVVVKKPIKYITSFYGIIDLLSTIPNYLTLFFAGSPPLVAFRALRLLRVFRVLKLTRYIGESTNFVRALKASRAKITVFLFFVVILCIILGTVMYLVESKESGFTSIPRSVYWAIVTLTTVGYGDIAPITPLGQFIASIIMIMGYGIIAVPTGIVSSEMTKVSKKDVQTNTQSCPSCASEHHRDDAEFCHQCGHKL
ncbi:ion transporter [Winogradskyella sp.]|uniref:ion transporter n=1 Tax=Winogradskyella sp. TaxID=1883156 RepID=UPI0025D1EB15|nr:ion transporter [Winogradskyella sp.]MCT4630714.1 ion transporter [Winogradskyella sp.]